MLKEWATQLWSYRSRTWAEKAWKKWCTRAMRSKLIPMKWAAKMVKKHLWGILNAVVHNADNAMVESINSRIKTVKIRARGFRNKVRYKTAIYFHCGGLELHP